MQTTTTKAKPEKKLGNVETTDHHNSLRDNDGKLLQEAWTSFSVQWWDNSGNRNILQPGQYVPIWVKNDSAWSQVVRCSIVTMTAFVKGGRYLINNGGTSLATQPLTYEVDNHPARGEASFLLGRAGRRCSYMGQNPVAIAPNGSTYARMTAKAFHKRFGGVELNEGMPVQLAVSRANIEDDMPNCPYHRAWDCARQEESDLYALPIPMLLSDTESQFREKYSLINDYPSDWLKTVYGPNGYYDIFGITEVGIVYTGSEVNQELIATPPKQVWRKSITSQDIGVPTLDPEIVDRMLPFNGPILIEELLD